jgi:hypothetical protein
MDPIGFGLENYDAVGAWRTEDGKVPIDASGTLPGGRAFTGSRELVAALTAEPEAFVRNVASRMLTYSLGRGLRREDTASLDLAVRNLAENGYRFSSLVLGIVNSPAFRSKPVIGGSHENR